VDAAKGAVALETREGVSGALEAALRSAIAGRGRMVVLSGEPGIGKSTMALSLAALAESLAATVVWGRAWEFADAPPYFPVRAALEGLGVDPGDEKFRDEAGAFRLWEHVVVAMASAAAPTVWIVEDVHAADLLTLDLLTFLAHAVRGSKFLVVATARLQDPRLDERGAQRLQRMMRDGQDLRLSPLDRADVRRLAEHVCGGSLPDASIRALVDLTGGNPLFVAECARTYRTWQPGFGLPPTVRDVVLERFMQLPEGTRETLAHGAVLGREFFAARVARMQSVLPARVVDAVLPALRAGIVTEVQPGRFLFSHAIVRDVVEDTLGGERRALAHLLAEEALAAAAPGDARELLVERARHTLAAASLGGRVTSLDVVRRAMERLELEGAHDRANALCQRVVAASDTGPHVLGLTLEDWASFARVAHEAGKVAECGRHCERVFALARATGNAAAFARAALLLGENLRPGVVDPTLVSRLEEARAMLGEQHEALACRVDARLASALQPHRDPEFPIGLARAAIAKARDLADDEVVLDVLDTATSALVDFAPVGERLAIYEEILRRATVAGAAARVLRAHTRLANDHAHTGDFAAYDRDVDAALATSAELGHPRVRWRALLLASMRAIARGEFAESDRMLVEIEELSGLIDDPALQLSLPAHRAMRGWVMHDDEACLRGDAAVLAASAAFSLPRLPVTLFRVGLHARLEDAAVTAGLLGSGDALLDAFAAEPQTIAFLAEAIALCGPEVSCRRARDVLAPHAERHHVGGHVSVSYDGPILRSMALLDAALGETDRALDALRRARTRVEAAALRPWVARLDYDVARTHAKAGRQGESQAPAASAAALAEELGMTGLLRRARALLASPAPEARTPEPKRAPFALSSDGDAWRVAYGSTSFTVRDSRGVRLLSRLVERPDEEIHVLTLSADDPDRALAEPAAVDAVDERARREYRERLADLDDEIAQAEARSDLGAIERFGREKAAIAQELARAFGLGGRARKVGSSSERARVNVQRRLKDAIARIGDVDRRTGQFLERAVRTGTFCCFRP
jgi:hypothetical protein